MHRLDIARATGHAPVLTADHDGVIVADVVAEWARRHGRPYRLELTGPAGGVWRLRRRRRPRRAGRRRLLPDRRRSPGFPTAGRRRACSPPKCRSENRTHAMHIHRIGDVSILNDYAEVPGLGFLPVNAFVLHAEQPVVIIQLELFAPVSHSVVVLI